ncbi:hypothetical protein RSOLAG1IB_08593 [Rhizoctonia solani AG-1 IB]|uniref:Uncharacterized protein n=1 Tax=Thanatephorus cucumeris (strain AG1-IB / isolate 7/3/14) TaxID=1108050 RepID=A0A0B7FQS2_THACB|nr:hypothetical protein RSOLAG1IB_08593 [Rhizoctonia solani AG-1 IB]
MNAVNREPGQAIKDANAGRFTDQTYKVSSDNSTLSQEFDRDHVLVVIEDAVKAGIGNVKGLKKYFEKDGILNPSTGQYPHVFHNREEFEFKRYDRTTDGDLYEYPIIIVAHTKLYFRSVEPKTPMQTGAYRVIYTMNEDKSLGYLQGLVGHKDASSFDLCPQFHSRWNGKKINPKTSVT